MKWKSFVFASCCKNDERWSCNILILDHPLAKQGSFFLIRLNYLYLCIMYSQGQGVFSLHMNIHDIQSLKAFS